MNTKLIAFVAGAALLSAPVFSRAEDKPSARPSKEEMREQLKNMSPEERAAKMKELRGKYGRPPRNL